MDNPYRVQERVENAPGPSRGKAFFVVVGPGATPYISAESWQHAEYLATWLNVAYNRGHQNAMKSVKRNGKGAAYA